MAEINDLLRPSIQYKRKDSPIDTPEQETKRSKNTIPPTTPPRTSSSSVTEDWTPESKKIFPIYKQVSETTTPEAKERYNKIYTAKKSLDPENPNDARYLSPDKNSPAVVIAANRPIALLGKRLGGGAQSNAYESKQLIPGQSSPEKGLVKVSTESTSYEQQKRIFNQIKGKNGLDPILGIATTTNQTTRRHLLFGVPADGDVTKIKWNEIEKPASFLYPVFKGCVHGLWKMHRKNILHRDMKGLNMLYKMGEEEAEGLITDFGVSKNVPNPKKGKVRGTLEYLPDFIFDTTLDQRVRETVEDREKISSYGTQTKEADVFSLGYALQKDLLLPAIYFALKNNNIQAHLPVTFITKNGPFTDQELKENAANHAGRVLYHKPKDNKEEYLMLFTSIDEFSKHAHLALNALEATGYDKREVSLFRGLVDLSVQMQNPNPLQVPTMHTVCIIMKKIHEDAEKLQD